jgi:hypothetical protein
VDKNKSFKYNYRYCNQAELCSGHGLNYKTVERWISEAKDRSETIPGRIKIPGVRTYIWDPIKFHDEFLIPTLNGTYRNEYEKAEYLVISNNLKLIKQKGVN